MKGTVMTTINHPLFGVKATSNSNVHATTCVSSLNVLTKTSDDVTIKSYFEGVHELLKTKGSDAFCVNLDEVWPLVYSQKKDVVRHLTNGDYFEGMDFQAFQNGKVVGINNLQNGVDYTTHNVDDFASPVGEAKCDNWGGSNTQVADNQVFPLNGEQDSKGSLGDSNTQVADNQVSHISVETPLSARPNFGLSGYNPETEPNPILDSGRGDNPLLIFAQFVEENTILI